MSAAGFRHEEDSACGFTLVEIAIALVIMGLLLGSVLKAHELVTGARVRNLIAQEQGIKAAFYGFQDRYRALPGDYAQAVTRISGTSQNGNGNGRIEAAATPNEAILAWEHLAHAGFLNRTYSYSATDSPASSPANPYGVYQRIAFDAVYGDPATTLPARHNLKLGAQIPVHIAAEIDRKIDDGLPYRGDIQFSAYQGNAPAAPSATNCVNPAAGAAPATWLAASGQSNCGVASVF
ncbi:MAG TPA: prepilin-type N-terminal cleavage/methylation domain-containing protein [Burkholderiales bacterium]|jgi:prepilin-type N-terminal cleavage/methylation domain-containing protein|nr:prepilin-type N-terminal cleavage/methylation domain-containing protein [Burkholderiales bacterium]